MAAVCRSCWIIKFVFELNQYETSSASNWALQPEHWDLTGSRQSAGGRFEEGGGAAEQPISSQRRLSRGTERNYSLQAEHSANQTVRTDTVNFDWLQLIKGETQQRRCDGKRLSRGIMGRGAAPVMS